MRISRLRLACLGHPRDQGLSQVVWAITASINNDFGWKEMLIIFIKVVIKQMKSGEVLSANCPQQKLYQ